MSLKRYNSLFYDRLGYRLTITPDRHMRSKKKHYQVFYSSILIERLLQPHIISHRSIDIVSFSTESGLFQLCLSNITVKLLGKAWWNSNTWHLNHHLLFHRFISSKSNHRKREFLRMLLVDQARDHQARDLKIFRPIF